VNPVVGWVLAASDFWVWYNADMQKELLYRDIEELPPEFYPEVHGFILRIKDGVTADNSQPVEYGGFESDKAAQQWINKQISRWWNDESV
jgi:hypothetical protein